MGKPASLAIGVDGLHCIVYSYSLRRQVSNTIGPTGLTSQEVAKSATRMRVMLLGTGTSVPDPDRSGPAIAIVVDDRAYLIDFGPGVVRRAELAALTRTIAA